MRIRAVSTLLFAVVFLPQVVHAQPATAPASADRCGLDSRFTSQADALARNTGTSKDQFACRRVTDDVARTSCFSGACPGAADIQCCVPSVGSAPEAPTAATTEEASAPARSSGVIQWPSCIDTGDCSLDDIVKAGAAFANFLFGISGAIFLAIFVYAGVLYLVAGGNTGRVKEAKDMLKNATIGIVLVFGAYALVTTVYSAFVATGGGGAGSSAAQCTVQFPDHVCQFMDLEGDSSGARRREATAAGCKLDAGLCPGGGANFLCCPVDPGETSAGSEAATTP